MFLYNSETAVESIKHLIKSGLKLLKDYTFLIDSYVLDFFVENLWDKLPKSWQKALDDATPEEISCFLSGQNYSRNSIYPLSLLAFRAACFSFSIQREAVDSPKDVLSFLDEVNSSNKEESFQSNQNAQKRIDSDMIDCYLSANSWWGSAKDEFTQKSGQHKGLHHLFRRHVKPKKQHEIVRLAQVISMTKKNFDYSYVIDIGAGQGHLSRLLSYSTDLKVIAIEAENTHVCGAQKFANQVSVSLQKQIGKTSHFSDIVNKYEDEISTPVHVLRNISDKITSDEFEKIIAEAIGEGNLNGNFAIAGLHTCGNLATTLLNMFLSCPNAVALFSVACCYMKLSTESNDDAVGYPLSNFVRNIADYQLSYCAREAACHAVEKHCEKLKNNADSLKIHCYRAALEKVIINRHPNMKHLGLRSVKKAEIMEFSQYASAALERTNVIIPEEDFLDSNINCCLRKWKHVLIFYCLRLLLASVVETVILLDRMIFLNESGEECCLFPLFDPKISPRNHVLIAIKK